jgi:RimJ/RimL family protein N-acetyltransferase
MMIDTPRLRLRPWQNSDREPFAAMNADPVVMREQGGPISRAVSDAKFARYAAAYEKHGFCRWLVESREGEFLGCVGIMPSRADHPIGPHFEIGWRLVHHAWGKGFAMEAAKAALTDAFRRTSLTEIFAYTAPTNLRSGAVMKRLQLVRDPSRDYFWRHDDGRAGQGCVWVARHP